MPELQDHQPQQDPQIIQYQLEQKVKIGANWFYWIAALSLINSILILTGMQWSFIVGLGATQMVDGIAQVTIEEHGASDVLKYIAFAIDLVIAGVYVIMGVFANKRIKAIFIVGMIIYALDALIFLLVGDFLSIAFHGYVLYCLFNSLKALNELQSLQPQTIQPPQQQYEPQSEFIDIE